MCILQPDSRKKPSQSALSSCDCLMHIKCGNVRPYQFLQIIATTLTSWKCPGCDLFPELPFFKLDNIELASEFENDGNNLLEGSNITVSEVYANSRHQSVILESCKTI